MVKEEEWKWDCSAWTCQELGVYIG